MEVDVVVFELWVWAELRCVGVCRAGVNLAGHRADRYCQLVLPGVLLPVAALVLLLLLPPSPPVPALPVLVLPPSTVLPFLPPLPLVKPPVVLLVVLLVRCAAAYGHRADRYHLKLPRVGSAVCPRTSRHARRSPRV